MLTLLEEMEGREFRVLIKHYFLEGLASSEIHARLNTAHGDQAPSYATVKRWVANFRRGDFPVEDSPRSGRPATASTAQNVEKIRNEICNDRQITVRELADTAKISIGSTFTLLNQQLKVRKLKSKWVPRHLTDAQEASRVHVSKNNLKFLRSNPADFWRRFITVDETWVHHYTPQDSEASRGWVFPGEEPAKEIRKGPSAGKVFATIFWDCRGIVLIDYLSKGRTVTGDYYSKLLTRVNDKLRSSRPNLQRKTVLFHHDNASPHTCALTQAKMKELGFKNVEHPAYSPDLAPSDYFLFKNLKKHLAGKKFSTDEEVMGAVEAHFGAKDERYFSEGLKAIENRWERCIELGGEYIE